MIRYKNVLERLKKAGYTQPRLVREHIIGNSSIDKIRNGENVTMNTIDIICQLLNCQPGDILEYVDNYKPED